jgi:hypothetical protein
MSETSSMYGYRGQTSTSIVTMVSLCLVCSSCERGEPPTAAGPQHESPLHTPVAPPASPPADATASESATALATPDEGALPQTKTRPNDASVLVLLRAHALFSAIQKDEPEGAAGFFFPKAAYEQVKAIPNPASDWKRRLFSAFERDIHALHARVADGDTFQALEVPETRARWVAVDEETNRIGYYRVFGAKLLFQHAGETRSIELKSMISWRGEWYVVHLSGFK